MNFELTKSQWNRTPGPSELWNCRIGMFRVTAEETQFPTDRSAAPEEMRTAIHGSTWIITFRIHMYETPEVVKILAEFPFTYGIREILPRIEDEFKGFLSQHMALMGQ